jgi:hypothetical protein
VSKTKSPTEKALHLLRAHGWHAEVVEHWNSFAKVRQDLMGFADILAFNPRVGCPTLALQVTAADGGGVAERVTKILAEPRALLALRCGWRIEVWGMRKAPVNGSGIKARTLLWEEDGTVRVEEGSLALESAST